MLEGDGEAMSGKIETCVLCGKEHEVIRVTVCGLELVSCPRVPKDQPVVGLNQLKCLAREIQADAPKMGNWRALVAAALRGGRE